MRARHLRRGPRCPLCRTPLVPIPRSRCERAGGERSIASAHLIATWWFCGTRPPISRPGPGAVRSTRDAGVDADALILGRGPGHDRGACFADRDLRRFDVDRRRAKKNPKNNSPTERAGRLDRGGETPQPAVARACSRMRRMSPRRVACPAARARRLVDVLDDNRAGKLPAVIVRARPAP